jgi:acetyltransferase-like isoleucine patch superfamily enzyme
MMFYYLSKLCKYLKPKKAVNIFNNKEIPSKKRNRILAKSGVVFNGSSTITAPFFYEFGQIELHDNVYINTGCVFLDNCNISIGRNSLIGPNVTLTTISHPIEPELRNKEPICLPIVIGENVWLGAWVVVLPGIRIGDNSVIAANSVVKSDVPANVLYAGCPAIFKKDI